MKNEFERLMTESKGDLRVVEDLLYRWELGYEKDMDDLRGRFKDFGDIGSKELHKMTENICQRLTLFNF